MLSDKTKMNTLIQIHVDIEARIHAIRSGHPDWRCRLGCDSCCRQLAEPPRFTAAEWDWLREGLAALPSEQLQEIDHRITLQAEQLSHPIICPLLDQSAGACRIYAHRPIACRTYGFYVQRDRGVYCEAIEAHVASGALSDVVWGNQEAIERRLSVLGGTRELTEWFAAWKEAREATP